MLHLHLYDDHGLNVLQKAGIAWNYCKDYAYRQGQCIQDKPGTVHASVSSLKDVAQWIDTVGRQGPLIDGISFYTHGHPGVVHLSQGDIG